MKFTNIVKIFLSDFFLLTDLKKLRESKVIYICGDADRTISFNGKKYSPILDSINDIFKENNYAGLSIASPFSKYTGNISHNEPININSLFILFKLIDKLFFNKIRYEVSFWSFIIKKVNPKIIIAIQPSFSLCLACQRNNINSIDLQHGWIPSEELDGEKYYTKKYWNRKKHFLAPDYFFVWDEQSKKNIEKVLGVKRKNILVTGNIWVNRFLYNSVNDKLVQKFNQVEIDSNLPIILVTLSQGSDKLSDTINEIIKKIILNTCKKYKWIIRFHPCQSSGVEYENTVSLLKTWFLNCIGDIEWHTPDMYSLPFILSNTQLHITYNSSTSLEASYMNIKTGFIDQNSMLLESGLKHLFESKMAVVLKNDYDYIYEWLEKGIQTKKNIKNDNINIAKSHYEKSVQILFDFISDKMK